MSGRVGAYLTRLKRSPKRKRFATFDLESKDGPTQKAGFTRPFMAGLYDGIKFRVFFDSYPISRRPKELAEQTWEEAHLETRKGCIDKLCRAMFSMDLDGYTFYAHNGGTFDMLFLLPWLARQRRYGFKFVVVPVQSTIQALKVERTIGKRAYHWTVLDTMRLLPMSLEKAARAFGLGGKDDLELDAHEMDRRWRIYNRRDNVLLYAVVDELHELVENKLGGEVGITAPATSMKLFRRRFLKKPIPRHQHFPDCQNPTECEGCFHTWVRQAYHGGRTELFEMQGDDVRYFDVNSSYVASLCEPMPVGSRMIEHGEIDWSLSTTRGGSFVGFAECTVRIPEDCAVPPLPYKKDGVGKLLFPVGTFKGVWDVAELELLFDPHVNGEILEVGRVAWIGGEAVFKEMMLTLWGLRDKTNPAYLEGLDMLAKLLGNGHYGKYAMDPEKEQIAFAKDDATVGDTACMLCDRAPLPGSFFCDECEGSKAAGDDPESEVWYQRRHVDAPYIIPQIAAHVTSLARIRLWHYDVMAIDRGGRLFMNDTDSVITNVDLPTGKGLGELKDEYPPISGDPLHFVGLQPKAYLLERKTPFRGEHLPECPDKKTCRGCAPWKVTFKGIPKGKRTRENFDRLQRGETITYERLEKVRSMARNAYARPPKMITVKRRLVGAYDKRVVQKDGKTTKPIVLALALENSAANVALENAAE
jgi:hypothetical protein